MLEQNQKKKKKKKLKTSVTAYLRAGKSFSSCIAISHSSSEGASQFITPCCKSHFTRFILFICCTILDNIFRGIQDLRIYLGQRKYLCLLHTYIHPA